MPSEPARHPLDGGEEHQEVLVGDAVEQADRRPLAAVDGVFVGRDDLFYQLESAARLQRVVVLAVPGGRAKSELAKGRFGMSQRSTRRHCSNGPRRERSLPRPAVSAAKGRMRPPTPRRSLTAIGSPGTISA